MEISVLEVEIDKDGKLVSPAQEQAILSFLQSSDGKDTTDIVVISHGWNNNIEEARSLYRDFFGFLQRDSLLQVGRKILAVGLLWPSKRFDDTSLIPGGAASVDSNPSADATLIQRLEDMKAALPEATSTALLEQMKAQIPGLSQDANRQVTFVQLLGKALAPFIDRSQISDDEGRQQLNENVNGAALLRDLGRPIAPRVESSSGGAAEMNGGMLGNPFLNTPGGAAELQDVLSGIKAGALRLLNFTTYLVMKDRAGKIGRDAVNPLLQRLQQTMENPAERKPIALHLVGHSFGARLVTAAADGPNRLPVHSLTLLQGAYSHNGLSSDFDNGRKGFFFAVVSERKVAGPILITHTKRDSAVGLAYPIASRLNGADATRVGDANDRFGGMGANGAQHVPQTANLSLLAADATYDFTVSGVPIYNLNADDIIMNHGDVARAETAHALAAAMATPMKEAVLTSTAATLSAGGR